MHIIGSDFKIDQPTLVTIGNFDGLHRGHLAIFHELMQAKTEQGEPTVAFSFTPNPHKLFDAEPVRLILDSKEKAQMLKELGFDYYIEYPFNEKTAATLAQDFIESVLKRQLHCRLLVAGEGYRFGRNRTGDTKLIEAAGIEVIAVPHIMINENEKISSTNIRRLVWERDFATAELYLSRPFFTSGTVTEGKRLGRRIGFPTLNLIPHPDKLLPPDGVYLTRTYCRGELYNSITNIGNNPTVNGSHKTVESFLFSFDGDAYGEPIRVDFYKWLRSEQKFASVEELKAQITADMYSAKEMFRQLDGYAKER